MGTGNLGLDDGFMTNMLGDFLDESQGYLANLNDDLMVLEGLVSTAGGNEPPEVDAKLLNGMFRDAHSLKGLSAMSEVVPLTFRLKSDNGPVIEVQHVETKQSWNLRGSG